MTKENNILNYWAFLDAWERDQIRKDILYKINITTGLALISVGIIILGYMTIIFGIGLSHLVFLTAILGTSCSVIGLLKLLTNIPYYRRYCLHVKRYGVNTREAFEDGNLYHVAIIKLCGKYMEDVKTGSSSK